VGSQRHRDSLACLEDSRRRQPASSLRRVRWLTADSERDVEQTRPPKSYRGYTLPRFSAAATSSHSCCDQLAASATVNEPPVGCRWRYTAAATSIAAVAFSFRPRASANSRHAGEWASSASGLETPCLPAGFRYSTSTSLRPAAPLCSLRPSKRMHFPAAGLTAAGLTLMQSVVRRSYTQSRCLCGRMENRDALPAGGVWARESERAASPAGARLATVQCSGGCGGSRRLLGRLRSRGSTLADCALQARVPGLHQPPAR